jgi:hypothetical protein
MTTQNQNFCFLLCIFAFLFVVFFISPITLKAIPLGSSHLVLFTFKVNIAIKEQWRCFSTAIIS